MTTAGFHFLLRFAKTGPARFLSQHDVARAWERTIRRAALPLAYSQGFSPRPRLVFGPPLPVGAEGCREWLVLSLKAACCADEVARRLSAAALPGLPVVEVRQVEHRRVRPAWAHYILTIAEPPVDLAERVERFLSATEVNVARGGDVARVVRDIRPAVRTLRLESPAQLRACTSLADGAVVTPRDLAAALGIRFSGIVRADVEFATHLE